MPSMVASTINRYPDRGLLRASLALLGMSLLVACTGDSISDTGVALPENRGTQVQTGAAPVSPFSPLAWSPDGSEIFFQTDSTPGRLMAASLTGTVRQLDGPRDAYLDVAVSADGASLYFAADLRQGRRSVYRLPLPAGTAQVVTAQSSGVLASFQSDGWLALPAPAGSAVAYTALPDSIKLLIPETGERRFLAQGCERIVAFSPDGLRILCQTGGGGAGAYSVVDVPSRVIQQVLILPVQDTRALFVNWNASGVRVVYETPIGLALWDVTRQASTVNWSLPLRAGLVLDRQNGDWSNDGTRVGIWLHECLRTQGLSRCLEGQSLLYVLDPSNGRSALAAVARGAEGATTMAFSPDGTRVAYIFDGKIYYQAVTPP